MTKDTDAFRKNRVLMQLESLAIRLDVVVAYLERKVAIDLASQAPEDESEAVKKAEAELLEVSEQRLFVAEKLAERVSSGEVTEEEKEEYMSRWLRGPA